MQASYNIILCRHAIDGLRLAIQSFPPESTRRLALLTRDHSSAPLFLGHYCPQEYSGLAGLFQYDPETLAVKRMEKDKPIYIMFPCSAEANRPSAELLDRLRLRLANWGSVNLVLFYHVLDQDLPPLNENDQILCLWEVRDSPTEHEVQMMEHLNERVKKEKPKFLGMRFYGRVGADDKKIQASLAEIQNLSNNKNIPMLRL
ncbi:MAG: hypothetical protein SH807_03645 [Blastochloris sp.]|nr:hypothetical protein [Blastochloris sp.]